MMNPNTDLEPVLLEQNTWNSVTRTLRTDNNPTAMAIANEIDEQRGDQEQTAIGFCGLPGAGKTFAAEVFEDMFGATIISMGDAIREEYTKVHLPEKMAEEEDVEYDSKGLAEFAAEKRAEDAAQIPGWVTDLADEDPSKLFAIDGVRSVTDYKVLYRYFDNFVLVHVQSPLDVRLERLQERAREGEGEFDRTDLLERDLHELSELGFHELRQYRDDWAEEFLPDGGDAFFDTAAIDWTMANDGDRDHLEEQLRLIAEEEDALPSG